MYVGGLMDTLLQRAKFGSLESGFNTCRPVKWTAQFTAHIDLDQLTKSFVGIKLLLGAQLLIPVIANTYMPYFISIYDFQYLDRNLIAHLQVAGSAV